MEEKEKGVKKQSKAKQSKSVKKKEAFGFCTAFFQFLTGKPEQRA
jgi:hypothetical protein